jgi:ADP-ribose pyrophosphatase YjhB (NUDIX family)
MGAGLVGGFMELGETVEDAARREALEETGLSVGGLALFGVFSTMRVFGNGDQSQIVTVSYLASDVVGEARVNDAECLELGYFDLDDLPENLFQPNLEIFDALRKRVDR